MEDLKYLHQCFGEMRQLLLRTVGLAAQLLSKVLSY